MEMTEVEAQHTEGRLWKEATDSLKRAGQLFVLFLKGTAASGLTGVVVGLIGTAFAYGMKYATSARETYPQLLWGLPFAGLFIVLIYHLAHRDNDGGTNHIINAVRSETELSVVQAPLIITGTVLTHLCGGSAGREGAALQLGGSLGYGIGRILRIKKEDLHVLVMCGMSACFSALFCTPLAAAVFPLEMARVGMMYYAAIVPCVVASLTAWGVATSLGVGSEAMVIAEIPAFTLKTGIHAMALAALCGVLSVLFCILLHSVGDLAKKYLPNPYIRIFSVGFVIVAINLLLHTTDYMGAGMQVIERCMKGEARPEAFILKMLLTALTLGVGFKGGEIVPSFYVGATFGCVVGQILGFSPSLCGAVGMTALFCGVTNSPMTSLLIAIELFGAEAMVYFLLAVAVSYTLSGYHSLYHAQKFVLSKYRYVNEKDRTIAL